ncbi:MAG: hypothetical protein BBJ57_04575 [Desulfobacterales bacterium PC51MH44]|nr:MAG: hypothetical protein BBJ57_04575 [Desulfobacterales bacterium PC51MH44]
MFDRSILLINADLSVIILKNSTHKLVIIVMRYTQIMPFQTKKTAFKFFLFITFLIAYGSVFPFNFQLDSIDLTILKSSLMFWRQPSILGDIMSNICLFVPFGFLGVRSMRSPFKPISYALIITLYGLLFAFLLQALQLFLPGRIPSLQDIIWNYAGCLTGAWLGVVKRFHFFGDRRGKDLWISVPLLLVGCWMACRLIPFVPSLDWGEIKHGLKPLLLHPDLSFANIFRDFVAWTIFAHLCSSARARPLPIVYFAIMILCVLGTQVIIVNRVVTLPNVLGALTAVIIWWGVLRNSQKRTAILITLTFGMVVVQGLMPFNLTEGKQALQWIPFHGFLSGNMLWNTIVLFEKMFLYGSMVWLLEESNINWTWSAIISTAWVSMVEIGQMWFSHHSPEITDPLIILLMALWIKLYRPEGTSWAYGA